jgi:hypothetical protein
MCAEDAISRRGSACPLPYPRFGEIERLLHANPGRIPEVTGLLLSPVHDAVCSLLQVVGRVGFDFPQEVFPVLPAIAALLDHDDAYVRADAAYAFGTAVFTHREPAAAAVPRLRSLLDDALLQARADAARALGNIGFYHPDLAREAVPRLIEMLDGGGDEGARRPPTRSARSAPTRLNCCRRSFRAWCASWRRRTRPRAAGSCWPSAASASTSRRWCASTSRSC